MRIFLAVVFLLVLSGCENGNIALTEKSRAFEREVLKKRGDARKELFVECMELAAKMPRQADDDVADIVEECSSKAYYMTNYIR